MDPNESLTREAAAAFLKISVHNLRRMAAENRGPKFFKHGTSRGAAVRYRVADLLRWQENPELTVGCARPANMPTFSPPGISPPAVLVCPLRHGRKPRKGKPPAPSHRKPTKRRRSK
jgi:hypothetical protein